MKMPATKKPFFRIIHFKALLFLAIYTVFSKTIAYYSIVNPDWLQAFVFPYLYGAICAPIFLYLFSHEDFFHFMKDVEKIEKGKEQKYLDKYLHFGKSASVLIIGGLGGPIFSSLTARLLVPNSKYKYLLLVLANIPATMFHMGLAKGIFTIVW